MYKIAIIEEIHKDGLDLLKRHSNFDYELIKDVSEKNLIKKLQLLMLVHCESQN